MELNRTVRTEIKRTYTDVTARLVERTPGLEAALSELRRHDVSFDYRRNSYIRSASEKEVALRSLEDAQRREADMLRTANSFQKPARRRMLYERSAREVQELIEEAKAASCVLDAALQVGSSLPWRHRLAVANDMARIAHDLAEAADACALAAAEQVAYGNRSKSAFPEGYLTRREDGVYVVRERRQEPSGPASIDAACEASADNDSDGSDA